MKKSLTEQEVKLILNKNMFLSLLQATMEMAYTIKVEQRDKLVFNRIMPKLNFLLKTFDKVVAQSPIHQHKVDQIMTFVDKYLAGELELIKKQNEQNGSNQQSDQETGGEPNGDN